MIYFPDFCELVLGRFRQSEEEDFFQTMFKVREMVDDDGSWSDISDDVRDRAFPNWFQGQEIQAGQTGPDKGILVLSLRIYFLSVLGWFF